MKDLNELNEKDIDIKLRYLDNECKAIGKITWGKKKYNKMREVFKTIKHGDYISEDVRKETIYILYHEIKKQSKKRKHSKSYMLDVIVNYEDIFDLVESFLE